MGEEAPTTEAGTDPFEKYRGRADSEELRSSGREERSSSGSRAQPNDNRTLSGDREGRSPSSSRAQPGDSDVTMPERMRQLRGEYSREWR